MLEIRGLTVVFEGRPRLTAVNSVNLSVPKGSTVGLVGESGSGKSTIARAAVGLVRCQAGTIEVNGKSVLKLSGRARAAARRQTQLVFQDPRSSLNPRMSVGQSIREAVSIESGNGLLSEQSIKSTLSLSDLVRLSSAALEQFPHQLSGGQLQRVAIARALAVKPSLLLLDEVTASLDVLVQAGILRLLRRLQGELGLSILYISHDLSVVRHMCGRVYVMKHGEMVESGATEDVFNTPKDPYTQELISSIPRLGRGRWLSSNTSVSPTERP